uniref:FGFR1 oncogene partner (FOP) N-terminal dimerisation domain-containing protein n=1 Tax=Knipowitschia caucasica TaxID=637954 RepID=A0AAV2KCJ8_KNICA
MSAAEDDTELRDLLLQNLENSGVLSRLKAQMRAAVFFAMEEQDRLENKTPLVNEKLKTCLNTREGRVVAALVLDFLQVFDLDFTQSVFEAEAHTKHLESRELLCKNLDLDPEPKSPVLLELTGRRAENSEEHGDTVLKKVSGPDPVPQLSQILDPQEDLDDVDDGDSFFDDPLPAPQKTYGCSADSAPGLVLRRDKSLNDLSALGSSELRKPESPVPSLSLGHSSSDHSAHSGSKSKGVHVSKRVSDRSGTRRDEEVEYDDDFNSELSVGEEIEEVSMGEESIQGPSDKGPPSPPQGPPSQPQGPPSPPQGSPSPPQGPPSPPQGSPSPPQGSPSPPQGPPSPPQGSPSPPQGPPSLPQGRPSPP